MTAEQLEAAARKYCELMGLDAEEPVQAPSPLKDGNVLLVHRWVQEARRIHELWTMREAIRLTTAQE